MDAELTYVRLYCNTCGNMSCVSCPIGSWINRDAELIGCTRGVDGDLAAQYEHIKNEVIPFLHITDNTEQKDKVYNELETVENKIYGAPLGVILDEKGKAKKIDSFQ